MYKPISLFLLFISLTVVGFSVVAIDEDTTSIPGQIAFIGADFNIYTYDFNNSSLNPLSEDATQQRRYQWPTWSNDGRVAYFCCDLRATRNANAEVFIATNGSSLGELVYEGESASVIYAYWSPANCADSANCRDLALLMNNLGGGGLSVEMLRNGSESTTNRTIDTGSPFYYHWNPEGTRMIFHRFSNRIDIFDIAQNDVNTAFEQRSSGLYQAPAWSPVDNRILFGMRGAAQGQTDLVISDDGTQETLLENVEGFISFLWSPDANYVAYRTISPNAISEVIVVDAVTGEEVSRSNTDGIIAFFWSPDSQKIAYLTVSAQTGNSIQIAWSVLDIELNMNIQYSSFAPSYEMGYLLQYFDQFSPSHRIWSPDSRYLVYSEIVRADGGFLPQVSMINTSQPTQSPIKISEGFFGVWSFE